MLKYNKDGVILCVFLLFFLSVSTSNLVYEKQKNIGKESLQK